ncbi:MAG TPA: hypothetical protein VG319_08400, partial [Polyangia bacterium]|nr:hypothetical protein [Polyangia bacterium]
ARNSQGSSATYGGMAMAGRDSTVEAALLDPAEQRRFVVRCTRAISARESRLEPGVVDVETRVEKPES